MITNDERRLTIRNLTDLYSHGDFEVCVSHMPKETNDAEGVRFADYFDFLQYLYAIRGEYMLLDEVTLSSRVNDLVVAAQEFGFPVESLDFL